MDELWHKWRWRRLEEEAWVDEEAWAEWVRVPYGFWGFLANLKHLHQRIDHETSNYILEDVLISTSTTGQHLQTAGGIGDSAYQTGPAAISRRTVEVQTSACDLAQGSTVCCAVISLG